MVIGVVITAVVIWNFINSMSSKRSKEVSIVDSARHYANKSINLSIKNLENSAIEGDLDVSDSIKERGMSMEETVTTLTELRKLRDLSN